MKTISKILVIALVAVSVNVNANVKGDDKSASNNSTAVATLTISGQVVDRETGEALAGVALKIDDVTIYTDFEGNFSTTVLGCKTVSINANLISYNPQEVKVDATSCDGKIKVELNPVKD
ncbi:hypothetical protein CYCD_28600 [Tenuifilaceae bacterium CYCD]|nr:hypothetical protein CYCD_28600 [Tenuifilaceae bacterium CYCD]